MKTEEKPHKRFDGLLADLDDGGVIARIDDDLLTLMKQTLEVARSKGQAGSAAGKLTINLTFKVEACGEVEIHATHTTSAPKIPQGLTRRWLDPKTAEIVESNPKQMGLPLRDGLPKPSDLRSV